MGATKRGPRRGAGSRWLELVTLLVEVGWWLAAVANHELRHDVGECRGKLGYMWRRARAKGLPL